MIAALTHATTPKATEVFALSCSRLYTSFILYFLCVARHLHYPSFFSRISTDYVTYKPLQAQHPSFTQHPTLATCQTYSAEHLCAPFPSHDNSLRMTQIENFVNGKACLRHKGC